ncbi:MAG TPA: histidine kinase [Bacteroidales bacterium]|nr:histidine kinase [Bacteroidales bacterium]
MKFSRWHKKIIFSSWFLALVPSFAVMLLVKPSGHMHAITDSYYFPGYLVHPCIYFLFFIFIILVRRINTIQIVQKEDLKKRLLALQLQSIKAQLDPHFTFNTLNSVASFIYLKDNRNAYDYMNKFTILLRQMLNDAEKVFRYLDEEIRFVTTYLELEKLRFGDSFDFRIEIGEGITRKELVPKHVLHTFTENAINHGLDQKKDGGTVLIKIQNDGEYLNIIVEDNGIGRLIRPDDLAGHDTKGLKLTSEFYDILSRMNNRNFSYKFEDLYTDTNDPAGTRVIVHVPLQSEMIAV